MKRDLFESGYDIDLESDIHIELNTRHPTLMSTHVVARNILVIEVLFCHFASMLSSEKAFAPEPNLLRLWWLQRLSESNQVLLRASERSERAKSFQYNGKISV